MGRHIKNKEDNRPKRGPGRKAKKQPDVQLRYTAGVRENHREGEKVSCLNYQDSKTDCKTSVGRRGKGGDKHGEFSQAEGGKTHKDNVIAGLSTQFYFQTPNIFDKTFLDNIKCFDTVF